MAKRWLLSGTIIAAALLLVVGFVIGPRSTGAQDMSASPVPAEAHPAHIHAGTCANLGEVMFPLEDVVHIEDATQRPETAGAMESTPAEDRDEMVEGDADTSPVPDEGMMAGVVAQSTTTVDASLDDILAAEHAINVHESPENIQNYIACGDITGTSTGGTLEIALNELNDSGYEGHATLTDNGDGTTTVLVQLMTAGVGMAEGESTPTS